MAKCLLGLGSNWGEREANLRAALARLDQTPDIHVTRVGSLLETKPVGGPGGQPEFLNAAAIVESPLPPQELLHATQDIERALGRVRRERWGPRTLDIDLLLYDDLILQAPDLEIPHPRFAVRRFMLQPAAEIAAEWVYPINGWTVERLLANLKDAPRRVALYGAAGSAANLANELPRHGLAGWEFVDCGSSAALPPQPARFAVVLTPAGQKGRSEDFVSLSRHPEMCPLLWLSYDSQSVGEIAAACSATE
jgi:2-amino-4-hydroxy-6-hydroxymethyldihydropteridine diphosphokinase